MTVLETGRHSCECPQSVDNLGHGAIWRCDVCERFWFLTKYRSDKSNWRPVIRQKKMKRRYPLLGGPAAGKPGANGIGDPPRRTPPPPRPNTGKVSSG
jgi:hypothetical protein